MDIGTSWIIAAGVVPVLGFGALTAVRRTLRSRADARALAENIERQRDAPRSLHPVIDTDVCIGSLSCLKSCPEGDILGVVHGAARLVHADHCIGHGRCAAECPVGAIQLVFGTARRGVDLPEVDATFESSRPGVYVIGELGGMGLLKNAMRQGLECAEHIAARQRGGGDDTVDVAIAGAGPAGLATALGARKAGLTYRLLEQTVVGGSVAHYPRQKVVMTETIELPFYGRFGKARISKEELLAAFAAVVRKGELRVEEGVKVTSVEGGDGAFELVTEGAGRVRARKVVLAVGRRGTPRRLGVPGEELGKVSYALLDPEQHRGKRVLVVGGGDSALEATRQLVEAGASVSLSYRNPAFGRCRAENRSKVEALDVEGRLQLILPSTVRAIAERDVRLAVGQREVLLPNDHVFVCIGGELPLEFLQRAGVGMRRYFGEAPGAAREPDDTRERMLLHRALQRERARRRVDRRLDAALFVVGVAVLALLAWKGRHYYLLAPRARMLSPLHRSLRSAGAWGHGVGIAATLFMLSNFLYAARKHLRSLQGLGDMRSWLHFHVFVGFMSPLVIAFHAAFQSRNLLATGTSAALVVVVVTGLVGRYIYGLVPSAGEQALEIEDLQASFVQLREEVGPMLGTVKHPRRVDAVLERVTVPIVRRSVVSLLLAVPLQALRARADLLRVRALFPTREAFEEFREAYQRMRRLRVQIGFFGSLRKLLGAWRILHASLALFLVLVIAAHIAVALYLGYGVK